MSESLYLVAHKDAESTSADAVVKRLQRVCALLDAILQSDRSRYLEARTWLLNSIASQSPPGDVRLACWEPLLAEALAAPPPPGRTAPTPRGGDGDDGGGGAADGGGARREASRRGGQRSPDGRDPHRGGAGGGGAAAAAAAAVGSVPGPLELLTQLMMLVSEVWPEKVTSLLLDRPQVFVDFFQGPGSTRRILMWFSHFSMDGMRAFKYGSHALAHFALAHREEVWELLRWEGKHPQAPVAVAAKTHYFCELALVPTVRSLLRHAPRFWASEQWRQCCRDGAVLELDRRHFCEVLLADLRSGGGGREPGGSLGATRLAALLRDFLSAPPSAAAAPSAATGLPHPHWQLLCQRLLHQLDEQQLLRLINTLAAGQRLQPLPPAAAPPPRRRLPPPRPASTALTPACAWGCVGEAVLAHALAAARGPLQRLLVEEREELAGRLEEVEEVARELHGQPGGGGFGAGGGGRPAAGCSAAAHSALLYGGRLEVGAAGRRAAKDRLLLLAELWTLRQALRRTAAAAPGPPAAACGARDAAAALRTGSGRVAGDAGRSAVAATAGTSPGGGGEGPACMAAAAAGGGGSGGGGGDVVRLPLERIMVELGGVWFERLRGGAGEGGGGPAHAPWPSASLPAAAAAAPGPRGGGTTAPAGPGTEAALAGGAATGTPAAVAAAAGHYELLPSEDEGDEEGGGGRRRRARDGSRGQPRGASRRSKKRQRQRDSDGRRRSRSRSRHGEKHRRKRRRRRSRSRSGSESPDRRRSRSSSRSGGRSGARSGSGGGGSSEEEARGGRGAKERRSKRRQRRHRREVKTSSSSGSSSSSDDSTSASTSSGDDSSSSEGKDARAGRRERCGSSGLDGRAGRRVGSSRRRLSRDGVPDSGRSSNLAGAAWYGARRTDSDDPDDLDPLALLRGRRGLAARSGGGRDSRDTVWRVRLPGGGGCGGGSSGGGSGSGAPSWEGAAASSTSATTAAVVEVVGACDDVADLLAAVACKHWVAAMLRRSGRAAPRAGSIGLRS
ncbi:hypothetical protein PLESTM_000931500 [Pleodorina starrii]|nr:hypothetical protein PLESTM_000931500 [Pleodorina starrii]